MAKDEKPLKLLNPDDPLATGGPLMAIAGPVASHQGFTPAKGGLRRDQLLTSMLLDEMLVNPRKAVDYVEVIKRGERVQPAISVKLTAQQWNERFFNLGYSIHDIKTAIDDLGDVLMATFSQSHKIEDIEFYRDLFVHDSFDDPAAISKGEFKVGLAFPDHHSPEEILADVAAHAELIRHGIEKDVGHSYRQQQMLGGVATANTPGRLH